MHKKVLSALLVLAIVLTLVPAGVFRVSAADMTTSEKGIALIKEFEGFSARPYQDNGQISIGWGTGVSAVVAAKYDESNSETGITEEEAEILLKDKLASFETALNKFIVENKLSVSQTKFDALISFTYNVGASWMSENGGMFRKAVVDGKTGNDLIFPITRWCLVNTELVEGLVSRRLAEANLYLNGVYSKNPPATYAYVLFNTNLEGATTDVRIQGFDATLTDSIRATASKKDYKLLGWYTAATGGQWVTQVGITTPNKSTLYAHWQEGDGKDEEGKIAGVAASYKRYVVGEASLSIKEAPDKDAKEVEKLSVNDEIEVKAEYMDASGAKWGKTEKGWVNLSNVATSKVVLDPPKNDPKPEQVTKTVGTVVNCTSLRIRENAGTNYKQVGSLPNGSQVEILETKTVGKAQWGRIAQGWICMDYVRICSVTEDKAPVTGNGTVVNCTALNIRAAAGTSNAKVGSYASGTKVTILEQKTVGNSAWGKTDKGWVCMDYIKMDSTTAESTTPSAPTGTTTPTTQDNPTGVIKTGVVVNCDSLRLRSGAGLNYPQIGGIAKGTKVYIYETKEVNKATWGRVDKGWICLDYVKLDTTTSGSSANPTGVISSGTVVNCTTLRVRSGAGLDYPQIASVAKDTKVYFYETKVVGKATWGRIDKGWICLDYVKLDTASTGTGTQTPATPEQSKPVAALYTGTVVDCTAVRIRSGAGLNYPQVGGADKGTKLYIYETKVVGNATWGRIDQGWVCMDYVKVDSTISSDAMQSIPTDAKYIGTVVKCDSLRIRKGPGLDYAQIGGLMNGTKVYIYETKVVGKATWGRIDQGWICLDYIELVEIKPASSDKTEDKKDEKTEDKKDDKTEDKKDEKPDDKKDDVKPLDLSGIWVQNNSGSEKDFMMAIIKDGVISVYWVFDAEEEEEEIAVYWIGSYTAPTTADTTYTWTSAANAEEMDGELLASTDTSKAFSYADGILSCSVSVAGMTGTVTFQLVPPTK